jgi:hypothetical protein
VKEYITMTGIKASHAERFHPIKNADANAIKIANCT